MGFFFFFCCSFLQHYGELDNDPRNLPQSTGTAAGVYTGTFPGWGEVWFSLAAPSPAQIIGGAEQFLPQTLLARLRALNSDSLAALRGQLVHLWRGSGVHAGQGCMIYQNSKEQKESNNRQLRWLYQAEARGRQNI